MNTHHHYLRLLRTFALATLTAAAVAACTDDNGDPAGRDPLTPPDDANPGIAVNFTANINPGSDADPAAAPGTRTVLTPDNGGFIVTWKGKDNYADDCDKICTWAAMGNTLENNGNYKTYVPTTSAASSELEPMDDQNKLTLSSSGEWTFTAVYGESGAGNGEADAVLSPLTQSAPNNTEHIAAADFSVATATQHVAANSDMPAIINFKFEHLLAALQLHVTNQTGEALTVWEIRLSAAGGFITSGKKYDVTTSKWKTDWEAQSDDLQLKIDAPAALASGGTESQDFHMLLFPGYADTDMTITVITDRGEYALTKPAPGTGFAAGHNYMTNITIKTSGLDPNTEKWTGTTISTAEELAAFRDKVNNGATYQGKTVRLTADIDLTGETWTPIGNFSNGGFSGTFDGGGYHISKLSVDNGSNGNAGLFGYVDRGTVRNLRVSGTVKTTGQYAGGIAGALSGTVENCIFDGDVSGGSDVGGIVGVCSSVGRIAGCHTKGTVTATATTSQNAGGIAGNNSNNFTIDGCYSEAEVKAGSIAGGIAGTNLVSTITHCYATGKVSGKSSVGGIVGGSLDLSATLTGCIALNPGLTRTEGNETNFGRVVGLNQGYTLTSCGAFVGMTLPDDVTVTSAADGIHGATLTREQCLTTATYTTTHGFTEATATTPGWAFDAATPWTYLPWNPAFASFSGISEADYKISVSTLGTN